MARKKVDCDWRLFEFSVEELEMILNREFSDHDICFGLGFSQGETSDYDAS
jgi:hypothetical protein